MLKHLHLGQIGKWVIEALQKTGKHNITALTREGSKNVIPSGVHAVTIDYANPATIVSALEDQDCLLVSLPAGQYEMHDTLSKAAADAKVKWIIPNQWGSDVNEEVGKDVFIGPTTRNLRAYIEEVGLSWTAVGCGFWYEFSLGGGVTRYGFDIPKRELLYFDNGEQKLNTSTFPQVGRAAANLLSLKILPDDENDKSPCLEQFRNRCARISSFAVDQREMFASLQRVTGTKESDWSISSKPVKEIYQEGVKKLQGGDREGFSQLLYSRMFFPDDQPGFMETHGPLDNEALGLPKEDLDDFTKKAVEIANSDYFQKQYGS